MNYLVLSNRVLLLENHWMLFHGKEKIKTNPQNTNLKKKRERDLEEVSAWLKRAATETSSEICFITKVLIWREQHEKSNTWFTEASLITHHVPPHHPQSREDLAAGLTVAAPAPLHTSYPDAALAPGDPAPYFYFGPLPIFVTHWNSRWKPGVGPCSLPTRAWKITG